MAWTNIQATLHSWGADNDDEDLPPGGRPFGWGSPTSKGDAQEKWDSSLARLAPRHLFLLREGIQASNRAGAVVAEAPCGGLPAASQVRLSCWKGQQVCTTSCGCPGKLPRGGRFLSPLGNRKCRPGAAGIWLSAFLYPQLPIPIPASIFT